MKLNINNIHEVRNYKVTWDRAKTTLGFLPKYSIPDTIEDMHARRDEYGDFATDRFYNMVTFRKLTL